MNEDIRFDKLINIISVRDFLTYRYISNDSVILWELRNTQLAISYLNVTVLQKTTKFMKLFRNNTVSPHER